MLSDPRVESRPVGLEVSEQGGTVGIGGGWRGCRGQITGAWQAATRVFITAGLNLHLSASGFLSNKVDMAAASLPAPFSLRAAERIR